MTFPPSFVFGSSTSAYQIEGAWQEDGKGESIWDIFCHTRGKIRFGHTGDVACDHYHRWKDDILLMKSLGLNAYRFSVSWPRIFPTGEGEANQKGLDFYDRLVDGLLEAGINPFVTLFHWDLPQALQYKIGGFSNRECVKYFTEFAIKVAKKLGDRVNHWITINEPWIYAVFGELIGVHAPGKRNPWAAFRTIHNLLLAHATAMEAIKSINNKCLVGISLNLTSIRRMTDSQKDRDATYIADLFFNGIQLDPLLKGQYPNLLWNKLRLFRPRVQSGDMKLISSHLDFLGVNCYTSARAYHKWYVPFLHAWMTGSRIPDTEFMKDGIQYTSMGWEVYPKCIYNVLMRIKKDYGNPSVYITENGAAFDDIVDNGAIHDIKRIDFLIKHVDMVYKAIQENANVKGYFVWSLLDNFEWAVGFSKRFGIVYVDYNTQNRIIKDSGFWYRDLIQNQKI
jgi:beta-glucosidase